MNASKRIGWILGILFMIAGIAFIVFGIVFYEHFRNLLCIFIGIGMIISNIFSIFFNSIGISYDIKKRFSVLSGIAGLILGAFYIPFHGLVMSIICGAFFIGSAIIRIILSKDDRYHYKREIPNIVIGVFVIWNIFDWFFRTMITLFGSSIIVFGLYLIIIPYSIQKRKKKPSIDAKVREVQASVLQIESIEE